LKRLFITEFTIIKKSKDLPQQAEVAQGVPGRLRPRIFLTFRHYKGGRSSAKRTGRLYPRRNPWYSLSEAESTSRHVVLSGVPWKKSPVTQPGIDPAAILQLNGWFSSNRLSLNLEKTYFSQFLTKNSMATDLHISYENRRISSIHRTKFLGLEIDDNLSWHCHIDQMTPKLNKVSYAIRFLKPLLPFEALRMVYFSTFHSIISYGIIFWDSSTYSKIIFKTQKKNSKNHYEL
jgi:hypothetical protein